MHKSLTYLGLFIFFWLLTFTFYFKTAGSGFVTDEIGWLQDYQTTGWHGIVHAFSDKSLHYVYHLFGFVLWKVCGFNGLYWMFIFISLHAFSATIIFSVFQELFSTEQINRSSLIAFAGCLLFLLSPYQTEPLVWYACIHYLLCASLLLITMKCLLFYLRAGNKLWIVAFYFCFIVSLFTLEISFCFPILLLLFFLFWPPKIFRDKNRRVLISYFVLPPFVMLGVYFSLSKILRGSIVGHYGTSAHLNFSVPLLMANLSKHLSKVLLFTQFISFDKRSLLYKTFEEEEFGYSLLAILVILGFLFFFFRKKLSGKWRITILLFSFFVVGLLPILNLYFSFVVNVEGDRFTYFASIFGYQFLAFACIALLRTLGWIVFAAVLFFNIKFLQFNTESWRNSGFINKSLIENFRWSGAAKIYLLNIPDNFRGAYMFRSFAPDNSFAETLKLKTGKDIESRTTEILEYNMNNISDSVVVEKISENQLKMTFAQPGSWWWRKGIGAAGYSTKDYSVKIDEWSNAYVVSFQSKIPNAVYLYQCGGEWREVKNF